MSSIPFQLPDRGLHESKGLIFLEDEFLVFAVEEALMGEFNKDKQLIKIEIKAIKEVRFERRIIRDKLFVRPKKRELLDVMPGDFMVDVELKIWRNHRDRVEALLDDLRAQIDSETIVTSRSIP